ncbi:MAG: polysaccharide biosynthesis protein, partial [Bacteroidota bacterium]
MESRERVEKMDKQVRVEKNVFIGDLSDKKVLIEACKVDYVIHLAGVSDGNVLKVNYEGTKNLIDSCVENKVKKFIFVSSYDAVLDTKYGKSKLKA